MIEEVKNNLKKLEVSIKKLREFGILFAIVFSIIGTIFFLKHNVFVSDWLFGFGGAFLVCGLFMPLTLKYFFIGWMAFAFTLGYINSNILLSIFFLLILTPVSLLIRLTGKDLLSLKLKRENETYWIPYKETNDKNSYLKGF